LLYSRDSPTHCIPDTIALYFWASLAMNAKRSRPAFIVGIFRGSSTILDGHHMVQSQLRPAAPDLGRFISICRGTHGIKTARTCLDLVISPRLATPDQCYTEHRRTTVAKYTRVQPQEHIAIRRAHPPCVPVITPFNCACTTNSTLSAPQFPAVRHGDAG
jgi:hypothetical protein